MSKSRIPYQRGALSQADRAILGVGSCVEFPPIRLDKPLEEVEHEPGSKPTK